MSNLSPTNLETADYGTAGWNNIFTSNWQKLNDYFNKIWILESAGSGENDKVIKYNSSTGKWEVTTFTSADIQGAINKEHAQGTDQYLDYGGTNQVAAADAKDAVDKRHTQNTDTELDSGGANNVTAAQIVSHIDSTSNPHNVTKDQVGLSNVNNIKDNLNASAAPTTSDDETEGYSIGSRWLDTANNKVYVALDVTTNNAIWANLTASGSGGSSTFLDLSDTPSSYSGNAGKYLLVNSNENAIVFDTPAGGGDMTKSVYDTDNSGKVDTAENLEPTGEVNLGEHTIGFTEQSITSSSGSATIDWTKGNKAAIILTEDVAFTFTNPSNVCNLLLRITNDATGGYNLTFPSSVVWLGTEPAWTGGGANKTIIVSAYFDGTTYWAQATPWQQ